MGASTTLKTKGARASRNAHKGDPQVLLPELRMLLYGLADSARGLAASLRGAIISL
jgi:hypothetical protein